MKLLFLLLLDFMGLMERQVYRETSWIYWDNAFNHHRKPLSSVFPVLSVENNNLVAISSKWAYIKSPPFL